MTVDKTKTPRQLIDEAREKYGDDIPEGVRAEIRAVISDRWFDSSVAESEKLQVASPDNPQEIGFHPTVLRLASQLKNGTLRGGS